jgi:hypothetical protein
MVTSNAIVNDTVFSLVIIDNNYVRLRRKCTRVDCSRYSELLEEQLIAPSFLLNCCFIET